MWVSIESLYIFIFKNFTWVKVVCIDSFFIPIDFFREATPENITGHEITRKEEGWIYFDRNGYLLKDSRRKRRGVQIAFTYVDNGTAPVTTLTAPATAVAAHASTVRKSYSKIGSGAIRQSSPKRPSGGSASGLFSSTLKQPSVRSSYSAQPAPTRRVTERSEYKAEHLDLRQYHAATQSRFISETESYGIFPEKYEAIKDGLRQELDLRCVDISNQTKAQIEGFEKNINGFSEDSRQVSTNIDSIEQTREREIKQTRLSILETLDNISNKNEGLDRLQHAQSSLTDKQNEYLKQEYQLSNLSHGNTLINSILAKGTDLNTEREQLYSKFNEVLTKDLEGQKAEVLRLLKETEDESGEVYRSADVDVILGEISQAIKTTAVDEVKKRENQQSKNERDLNRLTDQNNDLLHKIQATDQNTEKLGKHIEQQKQDIAKKEADLASIREQIRNERMGLVQDENKNADLEKHLQEMKNRLRFFEQEKLHLITESNIAVTKLNIDNQLLGERDKAMGDWMKDRLQDENDKKQQLEEKMDQ